MSAKKKEYIRKNNIPVNANVSITPKEENTKVEPTPLDRKRMVEAFIASQDVKDSSRKTYRESINQFINWIEHNEKKLSMLTREDILAYKNSLLTQGHQLLTVRSYLVAVRKFYAWAESNRLYADIAAGVKSPRIINGPSGGRFEKMHLTEEQAADLLAHFEEKPREYAMVNLMLRTGLRTIEVSRARIKDVTMRNGQRILQVWGKGMDAPSPNVFVVLTDAAWKPIRKYLDTRARALPGEALFTTQGTGYTPVRQKDGTVTEKPHNGRHMSTRLIQKIVKDGLRAIGLDSHAYSAHSLRHTTGTQMIRKGASVLDVQRTLRHQNVNTTMIYISTIQEEEHLRNAPESLLDGSFKKKEDEQ